MLTSKRADMRTVKALFTRADEIACSHGDPVLGAEHLLLSALEPHDGSARRAFEQVGIDPDIVEGALLQQYDDALAALGIHTVDVPRATPAPRPRGQLAGLSPSARTAFHSAATRSRSRKPVRFTGADVVAAVCDQEHGAAARTLTALRVDRQRLRNAAVAEAVAALNA